VSAPNITNGTAWSAATGGTQYTDLILPGGGVTAVKTDVDGVVQAFQGPDGINESLWVNLGGPSRFLMRTTDALNAAYIPVTSGRPGNLVVFLGASITAGSDAPSAHLDAWPVYASTMSQQRIRYVRNAGVPGDRSAQMLARFATDVTAYAPRVVVIGEMTNDLGNAVPLTTTQSNIRDMVAATRAISAMPVLTTTPPRGVTSPTNSKQLVTQFNGWIRRYAAQQGLVLLDFYGLLTDPTTGGYLAAYNSGDNIHPSPAGAAAMGALAVTQLTPLLPVVPPVSLCQDDNDEGNLLVNGCFTGASGAALVSPWFDNAGTPAGSVVSYTTDSLVLGQLLTLTSTATATSRQVGVNMNLASSTMPATAAGAVTFSLTINPYTRGVLFIGSGATFEIAKVSSVSGSGPYSVTLTRALVYAHSAGESVVANGQPGDTLALSGVFTSSGTSYARAGVDASSGGIVAAHLTQPVTRGIFHHEFVIAAGVTSILPNVIQGPGTGVASFGQLGLYNLTRQGIT